MIHRKNELIRVHSVPMVARTPHGDFRTILTIKIRDIDWLLDVSILFYLWTSWISIQLLTIQSELESNKSFVVYFGFISYENPALIILPH